MADNVKHPSHYTSGKIEVWDFIIDQGLNYCLGTVVKYIARAGKKDPDKYVEDLEKAKSYIDREIRWYSEALTEDDSAAGPCVGVSDPYLIN